jgi:hypothetical protein
VTRLRALLVALLACTSFLIVLGGTAAGEPPSGFTVADEKTAPTSGAVDFDRSVGTGLTECPQAGEPLDKQPKPLDLRAKDRVEQVSNGGDDIRVNQDYSCLPQDETSIDVSPANQRNIIAGVNDYMTANQTFYASTDSGNHWYQSMFPPVDVPARNNMEASDPAVVFDRAGVAYFAIIALDRTEDTNGVFVSRSTNGGFTWSKPCTATAIPGSPDKQGCGPLARGGRFDPRKPGDGVVTFSDDPDRQPNGNQPFNDKEYITTGPRPAGVEPQCFNAAHQPEACREGTVGVDRVYVTWTVFTNTATINLSYSDDQGRSWSPQRVINGSAAFCAGIVGENSCDDNQFSVPTTNPSNGSLWVAFENFNTPDENQYLVVRSRDGGQTFEGPFFVTPVFDVNYPRSGAERPDCTPRGQQAGRAVLDNICHRVNSGGAIVADRRGGEFADDLYLVMSDNRNGTRRHSNTDVFLFVSKDGGTTWIGPTRVNDDPSTQPANRNCQRQGNPTCPDTTTGNDQWFPWLDISDKGDLNVVFYDRRLDTDSVASEWPTSRNRPGNYLTWFWGANCAFTTTGTVTTGTNTIPASASQCIAPTAAIIPQPTGAVNPDNAPLAVQTVFPLRNFGISDVPSNMDYSFGGGVFIGDYNNVAIGPDNQAYAFWTDSRNGRSSRETTIGQLEGQGRNPICEQSDAFADKWSTVGQAGGQSKPMQTDSLFLVTPCPAAAIDKGNGSG